MEVLLTLPGATNRGYALDVDPVAQKVYWVNTRVGGGTVRMLNYDGTGDAALVSGLAPAEIEIDQSSGHLFWSEEQSGTVRRAAFDGSSPVTLSSGGNRWGTSLLIPESPPVALAQVFSVPEDGQVAVRLRAYDPDNDALSWSVALQPAHGTLSGTAPELVYTPTPDFIGSDSFEFQVDDSISAPGTATIAISVTAVDELPSDPTSLSAMAPHVEGGWSNQPAITMTWSGAADDPGGSGLAGYSIAWNHTAVSTPDAVVDVLAYQRPPHDDERRAEPRRQRLVLPSADLRLCRQLHRDRSRGAVLDRHDGASGAGRGDQFEPCHGRAVRDGHDRCLLDLAGRRRLGDRRLLLGLHGEPGLELRDHERRRRGHGGRLERAARRRNLVPPRLRPRQRGQLGRRRQRRSLPDHRHDAADDLRLAVRAQVGQLRYGSRAVPPAVRCRRRAGWRGRGGRLRQRPASTLRRPGDLRTPVVHRRRAGQRRPGQPWPRRGVEPLRREHSGLRARRHAGRPVGDGKPVWVDGRCHRSHLRRQRRSQRRDQVRPRRQLHPPIRFRGHGQRPVPAGLGRRNSPRRRRLRDRRQRPHHPALHLRGGLRREVGKLWHRRRAVWTRRRASRSRRRAWSTSPKWPIGASRPLPWRASLSVPGGAPAAATASSSIR